MSNDFDRLFAALKRFFSQAGKRRKNSTRRGRNSFDRIGFGDGLRAGGGFGFGGFGLEARDVPAIVSWTGAAANGLWSDARNWSGNAVPATADEVTIGTVAAAESGTSASAEIGKSVTIDVAVVVAKIDSSLPIAFAGLDASLRVTGGDSNLRAGLDLSYAGLAVQGASTRLSITGGDSRAMSGLIVAADGGQLTWSGLKTLDNIVTFVNVGSKVTLPDVTGATNVSEMTVRGGTLAVPSMASHAGGLVTVLEGGVFVAPAWANASGTFVEANGASTKLDLPALSNIDRGRFRVDAGATITANALRSVTVGTATAWSFSWYVGAKSRLSLPGLTNIDVAPPRGSAEATDARILMRGNGRLELASTTRIDGIMSLSLDGDSRIEGSLILGPKTVLSGSGTIAGSLDNSGVITPSGDFSPYGTITVTGDFTSRPGSTIDLQMGGDSKLDRIFVQGRASILGGALKETLTDEFAAADSPMPVGTYTVMTWASWGGQFTTTPDILPRADGTGITSQSLYQPSGLVQSLGRHRTDNDVISVSDMTVKEGNAATSFGYFVVRRSGPMTVPITVEYEVIAGSAVSGKNFSFPTGPITFAPGETERQIRFVIKGDKVFKGDVSFQVRLKSVSERGELGQSLAKVTIQEDDPAPRQVVKPASKPVVKPAAKPKPVPPKVIVRPKAANLKIVKK